MLARTWSTWDPEHSRRGLKVEQLLESSAELPQRLNSELPQGEAAKPRRAEGRRCTRPVLQQQRHSNQRWTRRSARLQVRGKHIEVHPHSGHCSPLNRDEIPPHVTARHTLKRSC